MDEKTTCKVCHRGVLLQAIPASAKPQHQPAAKWRRVSREGDAHAAENQTLSVGNESYLNPPMSFLPVLPWPPYIYPTFMLRGLHSSTCAPSLTPHDPSLFSMVLNPTYTRLLNGCLAAGLSLSLPLLRPCISPCSLSQSVPVVLALSFSLCLSVGVGALVWRRGVLVVDVGHTPTPAPTPSRFPHFGVRCVCLFRGPQKCGKKIGNAVFARLPSTGNQSIIVHYQCMTDPKTDPRPVCPGPLSCVHSASPATQCGASFKKGWIQ